MMFGHKETHGRRVEHLDRLRDLQDEAIAAKGGSQAGFTAFIRWTFQPTHAMKRMEAVAADYLRRSPSRASTCRTSQLPELVGHDGSEDRPDGDWWFGANDMGSTMIGRTSSAGRRRVPDVVAEIAR